VRSLLSTNRIVVFPWLLPLSRVHVPVDGLRCDTEECPRKSSIESICFAAVSLRLPALFKTHPVSVDLLHSTYAACWLLELHAFAHRSLPRESCGQPWSPVSGSQDSRFFFLQLAQCGVYCTSRLLALPVACRFLIARDSLTRSVSMSQTLLIVAIISVTSF
jgi:hypothetical protein